jgi:hypothetical protein
VGKVGRREGPRECSAYGQSPYDRTALPPGGTGEFGAATASIKAAPIAPRAAGGERGRIAKLCAGLRVHSQRVEGCNHQSVHGDLVPIMIFSGRRLGLSCAEPMTLEAASRNRACGGRSARPGWFALGSGRERGNCDMPVNENAWYPRLHRRAGLIDESCGEQGRLRPAWRVLQTTDRRLRGQWRAAFRTAADRDLHEWIIDDPEVDGVACHLTVPEKGGLKGWIGVPEGVSASHLPADRSGPIRFKKKFARGDDVFRARRSLFFKKMQIVRGCDTKRNVLVYMVYSDRLIECSPKN